jgi:putative endonuclease
MPYSIFLILSLSKDARSHVGTTQASFEQRIAQHDAGTFDGYTARRRPVTLVFHEHFERITDAIAAERQVKGWRRDKKEALIRGDYGALRELSAAYEKHCISNMRPSTGSG